MSELERDLREALRRREPPDGFAQRLIAGIQATAPAGVTGFRDRRWRLIAVAAMVVALVGGPLLYREQQRRANERAQEQLLYALRVTGAQVRYLQQRLSEAQQKRIHLPPEESR